MVRRQTFRLLDETGRPLSPHLEDALTCLVPGLQSASPVFRDESVLTEVLEEAGRKIIHREQRSGSIENLHGYAWVTVRRLATSWLRRGPGRIAQETVGSEEGELALRAAPAPIGTPEQVEHAILLREILARLTPEERLVCLWKMAGWSSQQIAARRGTSAGVVNTLFWRAKQKVRGANRRMSPDHAKPREISVENSVRSVGALISRCRPRATRRHSFGARADTCASALHPARGSWRSS
jgi:RNA polymerase sigma factor (sigma-70 family)